MKRTPPFLIAEIGINHNGSLELAKKLINLAKKYNFDSVKFQKRDPDICVPEHQKDKNKKILPERADFKQWGDLFHRMADVPTKYLGGKKKKQAKVWLLRLCTHKCLSARVCTCIRVIILCNKNLIYTTCMCVCVCVCV